MPQGQVDSVGPPWLTAGSWREHSGWSEADAALEHEPKKKKRKKTTPEEQPYGAFLVMRLCPRNQCQNPTGVRVCVCMCQRVWKQNGLEKGSSPAAHSEIKKPKYSSVRLWSRTDEYGEIRGKGRLLRMFKFKLQRHSMERLITEEMHWPGLMGMALRASKRVKVNLCWSVLSQYWEQRWGGRFFWVCWITQISSIK